MWRLVTCMCACAALCAAQELRCADPARCRLNYSYGDMHYFNVNANTVTIRFKISKYLEIRCDGSVPLDSTALPSFSSELKIPKVKLRGCLPVDPFGSFARSLSALNVTLLFSDVGGNLTLEELPQRPPLQDHHFTDFEDLIELKLIAKNYYQPTGVEDKPSPSPGFLGALRNLRALDMRGVKLPQGELDHPPASLRSLILHTSGIERLPDTVLALPDLYELNISDDTVNLFFEVPPVLQILNLRSKNTTCHLKSLPKLETLYLLKWSETHPEALAQCDTLREMELNMPAVEALPERWVARCPRLERLKITKAENLFSLTSKLLENATTLRNLTLEFGVLETLPEGLLDGVPNLRLLDLSGNRLQMLPSGFLENQRVLQTLWLLDNRLVAGAVGALEGLHSLEQLDLSFNRHLTDLCNYSSGYSPLFQLKKLTYLSLYETNTTRICRDWRENMTLLNTLDLSMTNISKLWFSDLQYIRNESIVDEAVVRLHSAPVALVLYSEQQYNASLVAAPGGARLQLDGAPRLRCDCRMYWARRALFPAPPNHALTSSSVSARVEGLRCASGVALAAVPPDELQCPGTAPWLPPRCELSERPAPQRRRLLRVHCHSAALTRIPILPRSDDTTYDLLLPNNNISFIHLQDLPPYFRVLDLRNNSVEHVGEKTAIQALRVGRVLLGGNPLACDCSAAPLLRALHAAGDAASDLRIATCADGSPLHAASTEQCACIAPAIWLTAALAVVLIATVFVITCVDKIQRRTHEIK